MNSQKLKNRLYKIGIYLKAHDAPSKPRNTMKGGQNYYLDGERTEMS